MLSAQLNHDDHDDNDIDICLCVCLCVFGYIYIWNYFTDFQPYSYGYFLFIMDFKNLTFSFPS